jgi:hypothetical protein
VVQKPNEVAGAFAGAVTANCRAHRRQPEGGDSARRFACHRDEVNAAGRLRFRQGCAPRQPSVKITKNRSFVYEKGLEPAVFMRAQLLN